MRCIVGANTSILTEQGFLRARHKTIHFSPMNIHHLHYLQKHKTAVVLTALIVVVFAAMVAVDAI